MNTKRFYFDASRWALLLVIALIVGCGQRGDLYLPDEPAEKDSPKTAQVASSAAVLAESPGG